MEDELEHSGTPSGTAAREMVSVPMDTVLTPDPWVSSYLTAVWHVSSSGPNTLPERCCAPHDTCCTPACVGWRDGREGTNWEGGGGRER